MYEPLSYLLKPEGPEKIMRLGDHDVAHCFELAASRLLERDELGTVGVRPAISY